MSKNGHGKTPVVEQGTSPSSQGDELGRRIDQQAILADLGVVALGETTLDELLTQTAVAAANGLSAEFSKVLQYLPTENEFFVRAGVGWGPDVVGKARVGSDLASPAGFALHSGKPVISNHLENETRFRTPELLMRYGIKRAMNVILQGEGKPFGVLEVDSRAEGAFTQSDISFLQGAANISGMGIERERRERSLNNAVARQEVLMREINHRVKNSLQLVSAMLTLHAGSASEPSLRRSLQDASARVNAVARAHERLYKGPDVDRLDLDAYLADVCTDLYATSGCPVEFTTNERMRFATDRAIPVALIVNELVTNAAKHAFASPAAGVIRVSLSKRGSSATLEVADEGRGIPSTFDAASSTGLGMRIVKALARDIHAEFKSEPTAKGAKFVISFPLEAAEE